MSYNFSFDKKSALLLGGCTAAAAVLLVVAGALIGARYRPARVVDRLASAAQPVAATMPAERREEQRNATQSGESPATAVPVKQASGGTAEIGLAGPQPSRMDAFSLQFGAFREKSNAEALVKKLKESGVTTSVFVAQDRVGSTWYTVRFGTYGSMEDAIAAMAPVRTATGLHILVRPANRL